MSWSRTHRRHQLVHEVLADIGTDGRPEIPVWRQAEVDAEFGGLGQFLVQVQVRWYRAFDARLDALLEAWPQDPPAALDELWLGLSDTMPTARLLLDAHLDHPALEPVHVRHQLMLHAATGIYRKPDDWPRPVPPPHADTARRVTPSARRQRMIQPCRWISAF
ncbi:hypothetical protein ACGFNU_26740 [Spirillospora sp. NPDC048911]|uniref:hypothetical protein n=1 Tax=Spirillospora sp. NPDC048911 TaxID=3364527 RepID=UPI0037115844